MVNKLPRYQQYNIITIDLLYKLIINMFGIENVNIIHFDTQLLLILYTGVIIVIVTYDYNRKRVYKMLRTRKKLSPLI